MLGGDVGIEIVVPLKPFKNPEPAEIICILMIVFFKNTYYNDGKVTEMKYDQNT